MFPDDDRFRDLLVRGVAAARAGSHDEARNLLELALLADPPVAGRVQALRALAEVAADAAEKRRYLEQILAADPTDGLARRDLAVLDGRLDPRDIVDPDRLGPSPGEPTATPTRMVCRRCGSPHLVAGPDGRSLICEDCHGVQSISGELAATPRDFAATMWTARGHRTPVTTSCITCQGCGASFLAAPGRLSIVCPYCLSSYTVEHPDNRQLIEPDVIVPLTIEPEAAARALAAWIAEQRVEAVAAQPRAVYQPFWFLNFIGDLNWRGISGRRGESGPVTGTYSIIEHRVAIPGLRSGVPVPVFGGDYLAGAVAYDSRLLAGRPAATYDVSLESAAELGRQQAIASLRREVAAQVDAGIEHLTIGFSGMAVDSFQLALAPAWVTELRLGDANVVAAVDGKTGVVRADIPRHGLAGAVESVISLFRSRLG